MKSKNLITVITDTQYTADSIAKAIGAAQQHANYYIGNGYAVVWTNGEIIEATLQPEKSLVLSTRMDSRLVYAHNYKLTMRDYDSLVGYKKSEQDKAQLAVIKALWGMSRIVVNAMRPDINGDCSFLNLYYFIGQPVEVRRAWLSKLTNKCIRHGVNHGPSDRKQYEKWLEESLYNKLVQDAEANLPYKSDPLTMEVDTGGFAALAEMYEAKKSTGGSDISSTSSVEVTVFSTGDHPLYNLPALLLDAAVELDFTHEKTIEAVHMLYAKKLISYPSTFQNTIPVGVWKEMKENMDKLRHNTKWGREVKGSRVSRCHNFRHGENFYNGHGIVTTGLHPVDLSRDEEALYNLIVKRVIDAFSQPPLKLGKKSRKKWRRAKKSPKAAVSAVSA